MKKELIADAKKMMDENFAMYLGVAELCDELMICKEYFIRSFKKEYGVPPGGYLITVKMKHAEFLLRTTELTTTAISGLCGYADAGYFCKAFRSFHGNSPLEYREYTRQQKPALTDEPEELGDDLEMYL